MFRQLDLKDPKIIEALARGRARADEEWGYDPAKEPEMRARLDQMHKETPNDIVEYAEHCGYANAVDGKIYSFRGYTDE